MKTEKKVITQELRELYHDQFNLHVVEQKLNINGFEFEISDVGSLTLFNDDYMLYPDILWFDVMQQKTVKYFDIDMYIDGSIFTLRRIPFIKTFDIEIDYPKFISIITDYINNSFQEDLNRVENGI